MKFKKHFHSLNCNLISPGWLFAVTVWHLKKIVHIFIISINFEWISTPLTSNIQLWNDKKDIYSSNGYDFSFQPINHWEILAPLYHLSSPNESRVWRVEEKHLHVCKVSDYIFENCFIYVLWTRKFLRLPVSFQLLSSTSCECSLQFSFYQLFNCPTWISAFLSINSDCNCPFRMTLTFVIVCDFLWLSVTCDSFVGFYFVFF